MADIINLGERRRGGPRTDAGKRRSSRNSLKTGVYSQAVVIAGVESQEEFDALVKSVVSYHDIEDPVVMLAAERFIAAAWRLRRVRRVETEKLTVGGRGYVAALRQLQAEREESDRLGAWEQTAKAVAYGTGPIATDVIEHFREGVEYLFSTCDLKSAGIAGPVEFDSARLSRIDYAGKPVQRRTLRAAIEQARLTLPPALAREDLGRFLFGVYDAFGKRQKQQREVIEECERKALDAHIGALELPWQDERSISDAERRLDAQFTRALNDFFAARRANLEGAIEPPMSRRARAAANQ